VFGVPPSNLRQGPDIFVEQNDIDAVTKFLPSPHVAHFPREFKHAGTSPGCAGIGGTKQNVSRGTGKITAENLSRARLELGLGLSKLILRDELSGLSTRTATTEGVLFYTPTKRWQLL
jgi:hypothetical protein